MASFTILRHKRVQDQIADYVREEIKRGNFTPGMKLPTTLELAAMWKTNSATVSDALKPLVKEGFLYRTSRIGTFVRKREERLTCVGIYHTENNWTDNTMCFERAVHAEITKQLKSEGIQTRLWVDSRPQVEQDAPWPELVRAAENREIQGLIGMGGEWPQLCWQNKLSISSSHITGADIPNRVDSDIEQFVELSLRSLVEQGCRSVGLIVPYSPVKTVNPDGTHHVLMGLFERFTNRTRDLGLEMRNEWVRVPQDKENSPKQSQERFGHDEFLKLWSQSKRPEGLIVLPDTTVRSVILAMRDKQVRVPEELKLVFHKNESLDLFCPMPATFIISSEREFARALIEQVQKQFHGESCEPISLPFKRVAHE